MARLDTELLQPSKLAKPPHLNVKPRSVPSACQLRDPPAVQLDCQCVGTACPKGITEMAANLCIYDFALNNLMLTLIPEEK